MLKDIENQILHVFELKKQGDSQGALELSHLLLGRLNKEEKTDDINSLTRWLLPSIVKSYCSLGDYDEAVKYALQIFDHDVSSIDEGPYMMLGEIYYAMGDEKNAFKYFDSAYAMGRKRTFEGYDIKYQKFYLAYKKQLADK